MRLSPLARVVAGLALAGCAKPADLPDLVVAANSPGAFAEFRAELGSRFPAERLKDFDTATQELKLDAMERFSSVPEREADMLRVAKGKTVQAVTVLGWQARRARFQRESADLQKMLDHDVQVRDQRGADTPESVIARIGSEREVIAKLQQNLADTEKHLAEVQGTTNPH